MEVELVVLHSPGPQWRRGVDFREQEGIMEHVGHYRKLWEEGRLLSGGPFLELDSGGMMVAAPQVTKEELEAFAASDPAVLRGLLTYQVVSWYIAMKKP